MLIAQQKDRPPLPQGRLPKTPPVATTDTQPPNPNTAPQQAPSGAQPTPKAVVPTTQSVSTKSVTPATNAAGRAVHGKAKPGKTPKETVQVQQPPPRPPTLEEMPAQPPKVRFTGGMLTVEANNSTLGDVLGAIRRQTGASLELPPGGASERIMARLGPAQPRDVIASLLNGSSFDYIILGSLQRPGGLDKIILTNRQNQAGGAPATVAQNPNVNRPQGQQPAEDAEDSGDAPDREVDTASEPEPEQPQPEPAPAQPVQQNQGGVPGPMPGAPGQPPAQQAQPEGEGGQQQQPQVKTPEQLLRELQQMRQQQQQQQQQQQNPGEGAPPQDTPNQPPQ